MCEACLLLALQLWQQLPNTDLRLSNLAGSPCYVLVWFEVSMLSYAHDLTVLCVPTRTAPGLCCCTLLSVSRRCCSGSDLQQRQLSRSRRKRSSTCSRLRYVWDTYTGVSFAASPCYSPFATDTCVFVTGRGSAAPRACSRGLTDRQRRQHWPRCGGCSGCCVPSAHSLSGQASHLSSWLSGNCMQVHVLLCFALMLPTCNNTCTRVSVRVRHVVCLSVCVCV